jgi:hypothetical protein
MVEYSLLLRSITELLVLAYTTQLATSNFSGVRSTEYVRIVHIPHTVPVLQVPVAKKMMETSQTVSRQMYNPECHLQFVFEVLKYNKWKFKNYTPIQNTYAYMMVHRLFQVLWKERNSPTIDNKSTNEDKNAFLA